MIGIALIVDSVVRGKKLAFRYPPPPAPACSFVRQQVPPLQPSQTCRCCEREATSVNKARGGGCSFDSLVSTVACWVLTPDRRRRR